MRKQSLIIGLCCVSLGVTVLLLTRDFPAFRVRGVELPGPAFFPNLIAFGLLVCGAAEFVVAFRARGSETSSDQCPVRTLAGLFGNQGFLSGLIMVACIIAYGVLHERLGFLLTTAIMSTIIMLRFKVRPAQSILASILVTVGLALIFARLLRVPLPTGVLSFW
ncbi:MAG: tripartite tricarboxylate transporter TctB family protein [Firmicutes bacterium]|jgi:putative tricarboxylic transport membrane protein|nr:tripartite tricarboxylate transporter TctB family protein [Bacillota bacterium]